MWGADSSAKGLLGKAPSRLKPLSQSARGPRNVDNAKLVHQGRRGKTTRAPCARIFRWTGSHASKHRLGSRRWWMEERHPPYGLPFHVGADSLAKGSSGKAPSRLKPLPQSDRGPRRVDNAKLVHQGRLGKTTQAPCARIFRWTGSHASKHPLCLVRGEGGWKSVIHPTACLFMWEPIHRRRAFPVKPLRG